MYCLEGRLYLKSNDLIFVPWLSEALGVENFLSHLVQTDPFLKKFSKQDLQKAMSTTEAVPTESEQIVEDFTGVFDITSRQEREHLIHK